MAGGLLARAVFRARHADLGVLATINFCVELWVRIELAKERRFAVMQR